jgi:hypothetical protein
MATSATHFKSIIELFSEILQMIPLLRKCNPRISADKIIIISYTQHFYLICNLVYIATLSLRYQLHLFYEFLEV